MADYNGGNAFNIGQGETYGGGDATTEYTSTAMDGGYASLNDADITPSTILMRRDREDNWKAENPTLAEGEIGVVTDKRYFKIGDGDNAWDSLKTYDVGVNIEDGLGDSEDSVMSQKAVTDAINNLKQKTTTNANDIALINSTANYNTFCTTKEGNEIFKEVYIYPYVDNRNVREIIITKQSTKYQITFKDSNNSYSYVYLGSNNAVINGEVISCVIQGTGFGSGATMYAVIDWNKVVDDKPISTNFTSLINDSKYSPIITHVMQSYKFVRGSLGNAFIRELYLENLRRIDKQEDGTSKTHYYSSTPNQIQHSFVLSSINRNVNSTWTINFGAIGTNDSFYPFKYETKENPENSDVIKADILCWIDNGEVQYKATMYAVVDWTQIPDGTSVNYGRPLLSGVVQKKLSPIIYNYIEINKLREELNLRPINEL